MAIESINPATGECIRQFEEASETEIDQRLEIGWKTYSDWKERSFEYRAEKLLQVARVLKKDRERLAGIITSEMGKVLVEARAEIDKCALVCEFYAENGETFLARRNEPSDAKESYVAYEPLGPVLAVMPWNFPFWQVFRFAAPALMAGNTAVLKHASNVPQAALAIEEIFLESGLPEGAFTTLMISSAPVEKVIRDPRIRAVTLTGSEAAGRKVAAVAGSTLKKSVMELGGSDPFIVLEDADIERAAQTAAFSRLLNAGQTCIAAKRFIVVEAVADVFKKTFKSNLSQAVTGNPHHEKSTMGPLAREDLREELHQQVQATLEEGATLELGGEIPDGPGFFYPATLLTGVQPGMTAATQETFGPVAVLMVAKDENEAIRWANQSAYGLGGAVWTGDLERGKRVARCIETGSVFVNGFTKSDSRLPFGGIKNSGYGRELSYEGIREFTNVKTVWAAL